MDLYIFLFTHEGIFREGGFIPMDNAFLAGYGPAG